MLQRILFVAAASILTLVSLVCIPHAGAQTATSPDGPPQKGGNFIQALATDVPTLDPGQAGFDFAAWAVTVAVYSGLVDYDEGLGLKGDLADRWTVSDDGKTYTFNLRPNLKFSDGTPLTSSDVRYSFERILDKSSGSPGAWIFGGVVGADDFTAGKSQHVSGIVTPDPSTVMINLTSPQAYFLNMLAMPYARIVSASQVKKYGAEFSKHPLGSGPFMLKEWDSGQQIVLERNPEYFDADRPYLNTVTIKLNQNDQTRILQFDRGELSISDLPSAAYAQISNDPKYKPYLVTSKDPATFYIGMKTNKEPFNKVPVRQALNYAVNKERLVQLLNGRAVPSHGVIPPPLPGYDPNATGYPYDPEKAKKLLAEAGYPSGFSTEIWTVNNETSIRIVQSVANDLKAIGVTAAVQAVNSSTFNSAIGDPEKVPMYYRRWWMDFPDPYDFFSNLLTKDMWGPNNATYYDNPEVDSWVKEVGSSVDKEKRLDLFHKLDHTVVEDAPWIFLYHPITVYVRQPNVHFYLHPIHIWRYADYWIKG